MKRKKFRILVEKGFSGFIFLHNLGVWINSSYPIYVFLSLVNQERGRHHREDTTSQLGWTLLITPIIIICLILYSMYVVLINF